MTAILDIMGLSADAVSDNDSLAAMGIDSMQLVEVSLGPERPSFTDSVAACVRI